MSARSMSAGSVKQTVRPPQRGIFPLDHEQVCHQPMLDYLDCLRTHHDRHHECRDFSKQYLTCRMQHKLMSSDVDLEQLGYAHQVTAAREYDFKREREGFVAGKHKKMN